MHYIFISFFNLAEMDLTHATAALASLIKYLEVTLYLFLSDGKGKGAHELKAQMAGAHFWFP